MKTLSSIVSTSALLACLVAGTSYASFLTINNKSNCDLVLTTTGSHVEMSSGFEAIPKKSSSTIQVSIKPNEYASRFHFWIKLPPGIKVPTGDKIVGRGNLRHDDYMSMGGTGTWAYTANMKSISFTSTYGVSQTNNGKALEVTVYQIPGHSICSS